MLFNEPKLLKSAKRLKQPYRDLGFSALQRAEIAEMVLGYVAGREAPDVSVLFNEPKLLKFPFGVPASTARPRVSVLFNEPKLLKSSVTVLISLDSAVSVLFNEPKLLKYRQ